MLRNNKDELAKRAQSIHRLFASDRGQPKFQGPKLDIPKDQDFQKNLEYAVVLLKKIDPAISVSTLQAQLQSYWTPPQTAESRNVFTKWHWDTFI